MKTHGSLHLAVFVDPMFQENGYLLWTRDGPDAWSVDPGFPPQPEQLAAAVGRHKLTLRAILLTHCHVDHIAGIDALRSAFPQVRLIAPAAEKHMLTDPDANLSTPFGSPVSTPPADQLVSPGDTLTLGKLTWQVLDVSGHSPGGTAYYCQDAGVVITGDALFAGGLGRTDFPGSQHERLLSNIRRHLLTLPDETVVYSGHGPATTIGDERETNPWVGQDVDE
jgi:glyoxylase-like metal-dependent hydrolase (beta-lactamase superfamily II)